MNIEAGYFWTTVALLTVGTLTIRSSVIAFAHRVTIPPRTRLLFTFIPAAIIPAIVAPMVFFHQGHVAWMGGKERLVVLLAASVVCWFTRNMLATLAFGLVALYLLTMI